MSFAGIITYMASYNCTSIIVFGGNTDTLAIYPSTNGYYYVVRWYHKYVIMILLMEHSPTMYTLHFAAIQTRRTAHQDS